MIIIAKLYNQKASKTLLKCKSNFDSFEALLKKGSF